MAIDVYLTSACNLRCRYCFKLDAVDAPRLQPDDVYGVLRAGYAQQHRYASFSGGEPFLYKPIFEVLDFAHELGYWLSILSHGGLITESIARRLKDYWRLRVRISLDGPDAATNDFLRDPGSFDRAIAAVRRLLDAGVTTGVGMTVSEHNIDSVEDMLALCLEEGVSFVRFVPVMRAKKGKAAAMPELIHERLLDALIGFALKHPESIDLPAAARATRLASIDALTTRRCLAGKEFFAYTADKQLVPCALIEDHPAVPSVAYTGPESFVELSDRMDDLFAGISNRLEGICSTCDFREVCVGGCLAEKISFDRPLWGEQPVCTKHILERLATHFDAEPFDDLVQAWSWLAQNSLEANVKRACMRQAPYWNLNFVTSGSWRATDLRFN